MANDYLACRERYKICYHQWDNYARQLCELLDCSFAVLDQRLLEARSAGRYLAETTEYARLGNMLDAASDAWDRAQQRILRRDLELIDC